MAVQFPVFQLVRVQTDPKTRSETVPTYLDGEFNGDKVPDKVELIQEGSRIGFRLNLGAYQRIVQSKGEKSDPLFGPATTTISFTSNVIWESTQPSGSIRIENFELNDFNADGDTDIRFTIKKETPEGFLLGVFVLMNQVIRDAELARVEERQPTPKDRNDKGGTPPKPGPGKAGGKRWGRVITGDKDLFSAR